MSADVVSIDIVAGFDASVQDLAHLKVSELSHFRNIMGILRSE